MKANYVRIALVAAAFFPVLLVIFVCLYHILTQLLWVYLY